MEDTLFISKDAEEEIPEVRDFSYGNKDWFYSLYLYDTKLSKRIKTWDKVPIKPSPTIHENGYIDIEFHIYQKDSIGINTFSIVEILCGDKVCWTLEIKKKVNGLLSRYNLIVESGKKFHFKHTFPPTKEFLKDSLYELNHAGISTTIYDNSDTLYEN